MSVAQPQNHPSICHSKVNHSPTREAETLPWSFFQTATLSKHWWKGNDQAAVILCDNTWRANLQGKKQNASQALFCSVTPGLRWQPPDHCPGKLVRGPTAKYCKWRCPRWQPAVESQPDAEPLWCSTRSVNKAEYDTLKHMHSTSEHLMKCRM